MTMITNNHSFKQAFDQLVTSILEYRQKSAELENRMLAETEQERQIMDRLKAYEIDRDNNNNKLKTHIPSRCGICGLLFPSRKKRRLHKKEVHVIVVDEKTHYP